MSEIPPADVYLDPDFDASSLKVAQLRGLLLQYGISFSSTSKKADLVQSFEQHIKPQAKSLLRVNKAKASGKGIISVSDDGTETASVASAPATSIKRPRGRPRKTVDSNVAAEDDDIVVVEQDDKAVEPPAKKPRARKSVKSEVDESEVKAAPRPRGRPSRASKADPVSDQDEVVITVERVQAVRPSRSRSSMSVDSPAPSVPSAPASSRRRSVLPSSASIASEMPKEERSSPEENRAVSKKKSESAMSTMAEVKEEEHVPEPKYKTKTPRKSEYSDFNPFQSGSEDAAERERRRRKSSIGFSTKKPAQPRLSEPAPRSPETPPSILKKTAPSIDKIKTPPQAVRDAAAIQRDELDAATAYNRNIQDRLNALSSADKEVEPEVEITSYTAVPRQDSLVQRVKSASDSLPAVVQPRSAIPLSMLFLLLLSFIASYKSQSSSIGYCDTTNTTNDIVLNRQIALDHARSCIARRTALDLDNPGSGKSVQCDVSALPLVPFLPRPTSCTPCPQHAQCEAGAFISCAPEYIASTSPLSILGPALDGLPGVGPVAFPPTCKPDTAKKRMIGGLAKSMESDLARGRGHVVCAGLGKEDGRKGQGERFGVEESALRATYLARRDPKFSQEQFEEVFEAALKDLVEHDDAIESIDVDGHSWYAAARTDLTLACATKLHILDLLEQWRSQLISTAAVVAAITYIRTTLKHRQQEKYKAEELVQVVLKRLQDQEQLHYTDPATTASPFIPPNQIRDLVMPHKGSTASRTRLWQRVQDLIEKNANVAVREQEVRGELWKTWEWTGMGERHVKWE